MRIVLIYPNYHSGGAEIAGNWPPAWVARLAGYLKADGFTDITFIDAKTDNMGHEALRRLKPDLVGATAITPAIYKPEEVLKLAHRSSGGGMPGVVTVLRGIHDTFMYTQVLNEAPRIDAIVRGGGRAGAARPRALRR